MRMTLLLAVPVLTVSAWAQGPSAPATIAAMVDREIGDIEKHILDAAEAMPESLKISGSNYSGVRTFALQVKHIAASNNALWSPLTGDLLPKDFMGGDGPESVKTLSLIHI